ncbi:MAG: hypothetical protein L7F77_02285 [Candidatus Magnetominusculus sp. LBB02]|nr:hypothetical protein [Candidatus Magnetominusculus sp. LBB02]
MNTKAIVIMWLIAVGLAFTIVPFKAYNVNLFGIEISSAQRYGFVFNLPFENISFSIICIEVVLISIVAAILQLSINRK